MGNELEYGIAVKKEEEYTSLYSHYIAEIDENGKEIGGGDKWIPFHYSIYFITKTISYRSSYKFDNEIIPELEDEASEKTRIKKSKDGSDFYVDYDENELIYGELQLDPNQNTHFISMFGTDRGLEEISFRISVAAKEQHMLWGSPQFSYEGANFITETAPDAMQIHIYLEEKKFRRLAELVCNQRITGFPLRIGKVKGFYAHWSPSFVASQIKVLTKDHQLDDPSDAAPHFSKLGVVGEMDFGAETSQDLLSE